MSNRRASWMVHGMAAVLAAIAGVGAARGAAAAIRTRRRQLRAPPIVDIV